MSARAFIAPPMVRPKGCLDMRLRSSASPESADAERLRDSAAKLRQEVEDLETKLENSGQRSSDQTSQPAPVVYTSLKDSCWKMTYRFASEPPPEDDDNDTTPRLYYSGTVSLRFKADGYTDLISHEPTGSKSVTIEKFWGWDEETSAEDDLRYLLCSADIQLPKDDPSNPGLSTRFYFQSQINEDASTNSLSLSDGTITVKKDVKPPGEFWGVFNGGGILAQFRYVGNFVQKPTSV